MGVKLDKIRNDNLSKIKIGSCIELLLLLDSFDNCFNRFKDFVSSNSEFFNNQIESTLNKQIYDIQQVLTNSVDIILNDIDKSESYCNYMSRYY